MYMIVNVLQIKTEILFDMQYQVMSSHAESCHVKSWKLNK